MDAGIGALASLTHQRLVALAFSEMEESETKESTTNPKLPDPYYDIGPCRYHYFSATSMSKHIARSPDPNNNFALA